MSKKKKVSRKCTVGAKDVIEMMELLEALTVINKSTAEILRAAKETCPHLIGDSVDMLKQVHMLQEDELGVLTDTIMGLKKTFLGDASIAGEKETEIISDAPRRIQ